MATTIPLLFIPSDGRATVRRLQRAAPITERRVDGDEAFTTAPSVSRREKAPVADARRARYRKVCAALRTLHRRVKDLWKFLG